MKALIPFLKEAIALYTQRLQSEKQFGKSFKRLREKFLAEIQDAGFALCKIHYSHPNSEASFLRYLSSFLDKSLIEQCLNLSSLVKLEKKLSISLTPSIKAFKDELLLIEKFWVRIQKSEQSMLPFSFMEDVVQAMDGFFTQHRGQFSIEAQAVYLTKLSEYFLQLAKDPYYKDKLLKYPNASEAFQFRKYDWGQYEGRNLRDNFFTNLRNQINPERGLVKVNTHSLPLEESDLAREIEAFRNFATELYFSVENQLQGNSPKERQVILDAALAQLKTRFKKLIVKYHSDKNQTIAQKTSNAMVCAILEIQKTTKKSLENLIQDSKSFTEFTGIFQELMRAEQRNQESLKEVWKKFEVLEKNIKKYEESTEELKKVAKVYLNNADKYINNADKYIKSADNYIKTNNELLIENERVMEEFRKRMNQKMDKLDFILQEFDFSNNPGSRFFDANRKLQTKKPNSFGVIEAFYHFAIELYSFIEHQVKHSDEKEKKILETTLFRIEKRFNRLIFKYNPDKNMTISHEEANFMFQSMLKIKENTKKLLVDTFKAPNGKLIKLGDLVQETQQPKSEITSLRLCFK